MAPVLQCPDCGEKHPLSRVPAHGAFPCAGCGRVLKVPETVARTPAAASVPGAAASDAAPNDVAPSDVGRARVDVDEPDEPVEPLGPVRVRPVPIATAVVNPSAASADEGTQAHPVAGIAGGPPPGVQARRAAGHVAWWIRLLLWVVAVPLAFLVVFGVARVFNLFTSTQLSDLFLASGTSRFWPVARLLPFVALVTAAIVQGGVFLLGRQRASTSATGSAGRGSSARNVPTASASSGRANMNP